ncbi:hypothetical protein D8674_017580 [Pyrus ussuriensis x Pyrus communis]|uniref:MHD domain-containing protein n=1 Tax=Pyrus ussuriensis x Pyrus communis TaxID=2448454 RepID=A0A5N5HK78_9ROSA|nr:hypothetical protein D8674_017580 [Pyrus ussuriensis x Pyrus communis]
MVSARPGPRRRLLLPPDPPSFCHPTPPKTIPTSTPTLPPMPPPTSSPPLATTRLSPQAASSSWGLNLGIYWVVYRQVNFIYVLDATIADHDNLINVFECIHIVNQVVIVIVTICCNVDVTPEKLSRKYAKIYIALNIVLRETITAGYEVAASLALVVQIEEEDQKLENEEESQAENDPFAASKKINQPEKLISGFKKNNNPSAIDLTMALATLEVMTLATPAEATQSTHIAVEGFEGDAWGGGLDASEFVGSKKVAKKEGLSGLELLQIGPDAPKTADAAAGGAAAGTPLDTLVKSEMKGLEMHIVEEISAEFRETLLAIVGLVGVVYLKTLPTITSDDKETEFSFQAEGTSSVKRFIMQNSRVSSLGNRLFHMSTTASDEPLPILKYGLVPKLMPLPLRVSPKVVLSRFDKELKWHIPEIPLNGSPGRLRARMPVDSNEGDGSEEIEVVAYVKFSWQGTKSLSGVCLRPAFEGNIDFYEVNRSIGVVGGGPRPVDLKNSTDVEKGGE